jgi:iron complex transport system substrate-binding protein
MLRALNRSSVATALAVLAVSLAPATARTVVDLTGRVVTIPDHVGRVACLEVLCYQRMFMLGADDRVVMMTVTNPPWMNVINPRVQIIPKVPSVPAIEDVLLRKADVAFFLYDTKQTLSKLESIGVPGLISQPFGSGRYARYPRNATDFAALLKRMMMLTGEVLGGEKIKRAEEWCAYFDDRMRFVASRVQDIPPESRRKLYYVFGAKSFDAQLRRSYTYWLGTLAGANMAVRGRADGAGMAAAEDVLAWDPDVVIVGRQRPLSIVLNDPRWRQTSAVRNKQVYPAPNGVFYWDGGPESILMMLFMAKTLYPKRFADYDFPAEVRGYYQRFYRYHLSDAELARFVRGLPPEKVRR